MKEQFNDDINSLTGVRNSDSGGKPTPIDESAPDAFERSWNWEFEVRPLGPSETAECFVTMGADDLATLTVDQKEIMNLGPRGPEGGGTYKPEKTSFDIEEGKHEAHLEYQNITLKDHKKNVAKLTFDMNVVVTDHQTGSSSSYVPPDTEPEPVDNDDEGEDDTCGSSSGGSSSSPNSSSSNPCPNGNNGGDEDGDDPVGNPSSSDGCMDNTGGVEPPPTARGRFSSPSMYGGISSAGKRVTTQTRKTSMVWRTNFGAFRGMEGIPYGMLEIVAYNFSSKLWTPAALQYLHPMASSVQPPSGGTLAANTAFQIRNGGTNANYYCYAGAASAGSIGGSKKRGGSVSIKHASSRAASPFSTEMCVSNNRGNSVLYGGASLSSLKNATGYVSKLGSSYTAQDFSQYLDIVQGSDGNIRQIWNLWDGLASIEQVTADGYVIAFYLPEQVGEKANGVYPVTGTPFKTFSISGDMATRKLTVTEQAEGRSPYVTRYWQGTGGAWCMSQGEGEDAIYTLREKQAVTSTLWKLITTVQRGENGTPISRVCETYEQTSKGNLCTSRIEAYGTDYARETTYDYNSIGKLSREIAPDGSVKTWAYDTFGRETVRMEPWSGGERKGTYTYYRYSDRPDPDIIHQYVVLTINAVRLKDTHYTYEEANDVRRVTKRTTALGAEGEQVEITETWMPSASNTHARGRVKMHQAVSGVQTSYDYEASSQYGALYKITAETQVEGKAVPGQSKRKLTYVSAQGTNTRIEKYAFLMDGTWALTDTADYEYDKERRWTKRTRGNGRVTEREMMCCGPLWEKDEDGVVTTYSYNTARQLVETIRSATETTPETIVSYTRDAFGRALAMRRDVGPMATHEDWEYDLLGQLVRETDVLGRDHTYAYSEDGLTKTATTPAGATLVTRRHADGTVLEQSGTGQRHLLYSTECTEEGIVSSSLIPQESGEPVLMEQSVTDGLGRVVRHSRANANGGLIHERYSFDTKNRLLMRGIDGMAPMFYDYDSFGNMVKKTWKLAEEPTPANSTVTEYAYACEQKEDGVYRVKTVVNYNSYGLTYSQSAAELVSFLSPVLAEKTISSDTRGNEIPEWTEYTGSGKRTIKKQVPDSVIIAEILVIDGYEVSKKDFANMTTTTARSYTATGKKEILTDARGNETTVMFDLAGREIGRTDAAGNTVTTAYDPATALPSCITDALGKTACYAYDLRGRKTAEYGTAVQPSVFAYDDADRLIELKTFRAPEETIAGDPRERTDGDTTVWSYDEGSGLMTAKTYADGHGETYSYDGWNRLVTKSQARTVDEQGTPLMTTYGYDELTGNLLSVTHNDATPAIGYTYNHLNLLTQVTDDSGTRTVSYNQYNEAVQENTAGLVAGRLDYQIDSLGRFSGYSLQYKDDSVFQTRWDYDMYKRLGTVSLRHAGSRFTYGYNTVHGLLETLTYPNALKRWYTREEKRDLLTKIDYLRPGSADCLAKVDYTYDALARPVEKKDYFNAPNPDLTHVYTYNDRDELVADVMSRGGTYRYSYDNIGNRLTSQEGVEAAPTVYLSNNLNQYISGDREPSQEETEEVAIAYATNSLNQYTSITGGEERPLIREYDEDGNQIKVKTSTGKWEVKYNALNQAVRFTQDAKRVECRYDYLNRRVEKAVYEGEVLVSRKRFIYRGFLQLAELDAVNATETVQPVLRKTYLWDPMESTATRILAMTTFDETGAYVENLFYTHDLLKNTTGLFDAQGERRVLYEYGPYGNVLKMEGAMAEENPFRFSSEYADEELGLVYYNYRYYNTLNGRWINRDIIKEKGGKNLYSFVHNKISVKIDYLGLLYYAPMICAITDMHDGGKNCSWTCQCPPNYRHTQYGNTPVEYEKPCCWTGMQALCFCDPSKGNCRAPEGVEVYDNEGVPINSTIKDSEVKSPIQPKIEPIIEPKSEINPWGIALGVGIIIGTIVEDVYTGGAGIADDSVTIGIGWGLIFGGL